MVPPNYRASEKAREMIIEPSCKNCRYSRQIGELGTVCILYFALVRLARICDSWDGGEIRIPDLLDDSAAIGYFHDSTATPEEREIVARAELSDMP
jgi:hypothetical protein